MCLYVELEGVCEGCEEHEESADEESGEHDMERDSGLCNAKSSFSLQGLQYSYGKSVV